MASLKIGTLFATSYEIAQYILVGLKNNDLVNTQEVCQLWRDISRKILKKRHIHYMVSHADAVQSTEGKVIPGILTTPKVEFHNFMKQLTNEPQFCIVFCKDNDNLFSTLNGINLNKELRHILPSTCQIGIVASSGVVGTVQKDQCLNKSVEKNETYNSRQHDETNLGMDKLQSENCSSGTGEASTRDQQKDTSSIKQTDEALVINNPCLQDNKNLNEVDVGYSIEVETPFSPCSTGEEYDQDVFSLVLIPKLPGVEINYFCCEQALFYDEMRPNALREKSLTLTDDEFISITGVSQDVQLKAFILFETDYTPLSRAMVTAALRRDDNIALGGGSVSVFHTLNNRPPDLRYGLCGITISGPHVKAASIVIPESVKIASQLEKYMLLLKECGLPETKSIAFMFSCCGRGNYWYKTNRQDQDSGYFNVETKAFRTHFPNTPIFGFFGNGEIGVNYLPKMNIDLTQSNEPNSPSRKRQKKGRKHRHSFTTVIVFLSFL